MREVRSPHGTVWECFIEWEGRRPMHRAFRRLRAHREARARKEAEERSYGVADGCFDIGSFAADSLAAVSIVLFLFVALVFGWPWIGAILFGVVELGIVLVLIAVGFVARTVTRRPWRVVAVNEAGDLWAYRQVGWVASRELVRQLAAQLEDGRHPADILPEALEDGSPYRLDPEAPLGLLAKPWARIAAMIFILAGSMASIVVLAVRVT